MDEVIAYDLDGAAALCLRDDKIRLWKAEQELENSRAEAIIKTMVNLWTDGGDGGSNTEPTFYGKPVSQLSEEEIERLTRPKEMGTAKRVDGQILDTVGERHCERVAEERVRKEMRLGNKPLDKMTTREQGSFSAKLSRAKSEEIKKYLATPPNERRDVEILSYDREATRQYEEAKKMPGFTRRDENGKEIFTTQPSPRVLRRLEYSDRDVV